VQFERFADNALVHPATRRRARRVLSAPRTTAVRISPLAVPPMSGNAHSSAATNAEAKRQALGAVLVPGDRPLMFTSRPYAGAGDRHALDPGDPDSDHRNAATKSIPRLFSEHGRLSQLDHAILHTRAGQASLADPGSQVATLERFL
jgi:hypothetical protein